MTTWTLATPPTAGAVAIIQLHGNIDPALASLNIKPVVVGEVRLRDLLNIDRGIVARFTTDTCQLMPHGGVAVLRALAAELTRRGIPEKSDIDPVSMYPEARSQVEARALAALARAASPLAVDLLLPQHDLWSNPSAASDPARDRVLNHLIDPPLVVAVGASNVGKSTLVNALAGRSVSVVADEPGTTRDHVGVMIDLAGLVVRYVDTPGLRDGAGEIEKEAVAGAMTVAAKADLLLVCGDATAAPPVLPEKLAAKDRIVVGLRSDLGAAGFKVDQSVSVARGEGVQELVAAIKGRILPEGILKQDVPWRFW